MSAQPLGQVVDPADERYRRIIDVLIALQPGVVALHGFCFLAFFLFFLYQF